MQAQCVSSSISVIAGDLRTLLRKYASKVVSVATSLFACAGPEGEERSEHCRRQPSGMHRVKIELACARQVPFKAWR